MNQREHIVRVFRALHDELEVHCFGVSACLLLDGDFDWDLLRGYAYTEERGEGGYTVGINPELMYCGRQRIEGVLMHELGHVALLHRGQRRHTERDADDMARRLFGKTIRYDEEDVQTTGHGVSPRPRHLDDAKGCTL